MLFQAASSVEPESDQLSISLSLVGGEEEEEDEELEAAAEHLGKEIISQVLPELKGDSQGVSNEGLEEVGDGDGRGGGGGRGVSGGEAPKRKHIPLRSFLGPLPSAASLGLKDSIRECITDNAEQGG